MDLKPGGFTQRYISGCPNDEDRRESVTYMKSVMK
jgi:hypothetical protein